MSDAVQAIGALDASLAAGSDASIQFPLTASATSIAKSTSGTADATAKVNDVNLTAGVDSEITASSTNGAAVALTDQVGVVASSTSGVAQAGCSLDFIGDLGDSGNSTAGTVITARPHESSASTCGDAHCRFCASAHFCASAFLALRFCALPLKWIND